MNTVRCLAGFALIMIVASCQNSPSAPDTPVVVADLRLAEGEVAGWSDQALGYTSDGFREIEGLAGLEALINGGAAQYVDIGFTVGFVQEMGTQTNRSYTAFVMDFGTDDSAASMYDTKKNTYTGNQDLPTLPLSQAFGYDIISGVQVFAHNSRFYFELALTGYGADNALARTEAETFLRAYFARLD